MKKNRFYILAAAVLLLICLVVILFKTGVFHTSNSIPKSDIFAVRDTSTISKIFIADMNGEHVLLNRRDGEWYVDDSIRAQDKRPVRGDQQCDLTTAGGQNRPIQHQQDDVGECD